MRSAPTFVLYLHVGKLLLRMVMAPWCKSWVMGDQGSDWSLCNQTEVVYYDAARPSAICLLNAVPPVFVGGWVCVCICEGMCVHVIQCLKPCVLTGLPYQMCVLGACACLCKGLGICVVFVVTLIDCVVNTQTTTHTTHTTRHKTHNNTTT